MAGVASAKSNQKLCCVPGAGLTCWLGGAVAGLGRGRMARCAAAQGSC